MLPAHLVHPHWVLEALCHELAAVAEQEAFASAEFPYGIGDQDLPTFSLRRDARRKNHRRPEQVALLFYLEERVRLLEELQADMNDGGRRWN